MSRRLDLGPVDVTSSVLSSPEAQQRDLEASISQLVLENDDVSIDDKGEGGVSLALCLATICLSFLCHILSSVDVSLFVLQCLVMFYPLLPLGSLSYTYLSSFT